MKPSVLAVLVILLPLAGCQTGTYMSSAATDGDGVTCAEITQAFNAYQRDRDSARALQQLTALIDPETGALAAQGMTAADEHYTSVRASVNLALAVRGCQPVNY